MPKGRFLPLSDRQLIYQHVVYNNHTAKEIHDIVFNNDKDRISIYRLIKLVTMFRNKNGKYTHCIDTFLYDDNIRKNSSTGRPRIFLKESREDILRISRENVRMNTGTIALEHQKFYIDPNSAPKRSFVGDILYREGNLRYKTIEFRHIRARQRQFNAFCYLIQHVPPHLLQATDEMKASPKKFINNKGRSVLGTRCI